MTDLATLKTRKLEAELALHRLLTGSKEESVEFGPQRRVVFSRVNISDLQKYISDLSAEIDALEGRRRRGPIYIVPGGR